MLKYTELEPSRNCYFNSLYYKNQGRTSATNTESTITQPQDHNTVGTLNILIFLSTDFLLNPLNGTIYKCISEIHQSMFLTQSEITKTIILHQRRSMT